MENELSDIPIDEILERHSLCSLHAIYLRSSMYMRIIPALAGNTSPAGAHHPHPRDHPRACGEHSICCCASLIVVGSSPRLRGTRKREVAAWRGVGIIPALAGNTLRVLTSSVSTGDHPRACGEHSYQCSKALCSLGSSPRLRGTRQVRACGRDRHGIIPALAGNTHARFVRPYRRRDHPRACGEHVTVPQDAILTAGSSPRLRGTHTHER